jgi:hypothetical protein
MEPTSSPQSGRSAREAARRGADATRHSRFLGAQQPRPLSGAPQARSQPQASDPPAPKASSAAGVTCEDGVRRRWGCLVVVRGCPLGTVQDCCEWHACGTAVEDDARYPVAPLAPS